MSKHSLKGLVVPLVIALVSACNRLPVPIPPAPKATELPLATAIPTQATPTEVPASATAPASAAATASATATALSPTESLSNVVEAPRFTHPTDITNPYYPVSLISQSISLGTEGGEA